MVLRACYAVCGTELAYGATGSYAPQSTGSASGQYCDSVWCYAMSGTARAYGATQCAVLR
eukprot:3940929-Rhodomonas_salina.1